MNIVLLVVGVLAGIYLHRQYELFIDRKKIFTVLRVFDSGSYAVTWTNYVRNWFELHPDEFKLVRLKVKSYPWTEYPKVKIMYKSLTGKRLAFHATQRCLCTEVIDKIIDCNSIQQKD